MRLYVLIFLFAMIFINCAHRHAHFVKDGLLRQGIHSQAFLEVWGDPDRIDTVSSEDETISASWRGGYGGFFKGRRSFVRWTYEEIGIELYFRENALAGWETKRTVSELKSFAKP